jgi:methylmalonyl-CoA mutase C-terminal domain/subunit
VVELLGEIGAGDIVVCGGGIIPDDDIKKLKKAGVAEIFSPGTPLDDIVAWVKENVKPREY